MSPEPQRIAIAEACGWKFPKGEGANGPFVIKPDGTDLWHEDDPVGISMALSWNYIPNYLSDLNAMHEAENCLSPIAQMTYVSYLQAKEIEDSFDQAWATTHATASQRAEAFLRTLNLWTDE